METKSNEGDETFPESWQEQQPALVVSRLPSPPGRWRRIEIFTDVDVKSTARGDGSLSALLPEVVLTNLLQRGSPRGAGVSQEGYQSIGPGGTDQERRSTRRERLTSDAGSRHKRRSDKRKKSSSENPHHGTPGSILHIPQTTRRALRTGGGSRVYNLDRRSGAGQD